MCWDSPCIGVRPRSEGKVGGIQRYARLGPEVLKRHKRQGCHWPRKQGGQQVRPKPGSERIWKGVWRGGGWWETCRAAGANQPGMTKSYKNPHSEVSLLPSSTSEALGFPTCLFPFILQALHIPTEAKQWLNTSPTLLPMRQTNKVFFYWSFQKWQSTDSVVLKS